MRSRQFLIAGVLVVSSCGDPSTERGTGSPIETTAATEAPPATRLMEPPPARADVSAVDAVDIDEPCPADVPVDMNATESSLMFDEQGRLEPMLGVVL